MSAEPNRGSEAYVERAQVIVGQRAATLIAAAITCFLVTPVAGQTWNHTTRFQPRPLPWSGASYAPTGIGSSAVGFRGFNAGPTQFLGRLSANPYATDSITNPYSQFGSAYNPLSVNNPYGRYGSPYSSASATNPYTVNAPRLYGADGTYLGKLSANRFDADSISNPYGRYGSPFGADSVHNPYSRFGSRFSASSATNPYGVSAPLIVGQ